MEDKMQQINKRMERCYYTVNGLDREIKRKRELHDHLSMLDVNRDFPDYQYFNTNEEDFEEIQDTIDRLHVYLLNYSTKEELTAYLNLIRTGEITPAFKDEPWFKNGFLGLPS